MNVQSTVDLYFVLEASCGSIFFISFRFVSGWETRRVHVWFFFFVNRCTVYDDIRWLSEGEKPGLLTTDRKLISSSFYYPDLGLENLEHGY